MIAREQALVEAQHQHLQSGAIHPGGIYHLPA
jgi:hypothetical protein